MHPREFKINMHIIVFETTSSYLCYSLCLFTVLELYLFCVRFWNSLHHSLARSALCCSFMPKWCWNSIIKPTHSCFSSFRIFLREDEHENANETELLQHALLFSHFRSIKNANFNRVRPLRMHSTLLGIMLLSDTSVRSYELSEFAFKWASRLFLLCQFFQFFFFAQI